jgi:hypothetical protein
MIDSKRIEQTSIPFETKRLSVRNENKLKGETGRNGPDHPFELKMLGGEKSCGAREIRINRFRCDALNPASIRDRIVISIDER